MRPNLKLVPKRSGNYARPIPRLVPLTAELFSMALASSEDEIVAQRAMGHINSILAPGLSFAVLDGGTLAIVYGIFPVVFGRAHGWMVRTPLATRRHLAFAVRQARAHFDRWNQQEAFRRIEIQILDGQPWRESFAKRLGMNECFGPMRKWDEMGRDYWLYARIAP